VELRDRFAKTAMKTLLYVALTTGEEDYTWRDIAEESYRLADEMMKARSA
jgi:hypothetical protein